MEICWYCKKSLDCKKASTITFACDYIYKRSKEREDCINHVVINWHCFNHAFSRICVDTAGTIFVSFPYNERNAKQKWLYKKEKMGLI